jgi:hypothetical protein
MRKLITLLLMLSGVLAYGQTLTFKSYKNGKVVATKTIPYPTKVITRVIYKYVTVEKIRKVNVPVPKPVPKIEYKIVEVAGKPTALDTVSILQQYYPKNVFTDVLVLEKGQGKVTISDTISHNRLVGRTFTAEIKPKLVRERVEVVQPNVREYYLGPEATTNFNGINNWYGMNVLLKNKQNNIIKLGAGINMRDGIDGTKPYLVGGFYFKIK